MSGGWRRPDDKFRPNAISKPTESPSTIETQKDLASEFKVYTEDEAAAFLKMTVRMLRIRRKKGKIGYVKDGKYICYTEAQLKEYCQAHEEFMMVEKKAGVVRAKRRSPADLMKELVRRERRVRDLERNLQEFYGPIIKDKLKR